MKKILFEDACILSVAQLARFLVHHLPFRFSLFVGKLIGAFIYFFHKRKKVAYKNLRAAFAAEKSRSEMKRIARRSVQNMAMSMVELLRFPDLTRVYIDKHVKILGAEKVKPSLAEGKGTIFLTAHFGNWELLNATGGIIGYPMVALARSQKHPRSDEFLNNLRTSTGNQVIRKGMPIREILKALKNGQIVGMLSDQDGGKSGTFVRFFGRLSSTPSGVVTFALRTGAPIFPVFNFRHDIDRHRVEVEGPLRVPDLMEDSEEAERQVLQQFAEILESKIRKSPDQWLWGHRRWKSTPDRFVLILNDGKQGHLNQALAVLETFKEQRALEGFRPEHTHSKVISIEYKNETLRNLFQFFCIASQGRIPFKSWVLRTVLTGACFQEVMKSYADIVISCGSSQAGVNLLIKSENVAKSIVVMKPPFSSKRFDLVVAPRHDKMEESHRVVVTEKALTLFNSEILKKEAERLKSEFNLSASKKKIGFLVGGDTSETSFSEKAFGQILTGIQNYAVQKKVFILATSSRRTPRWADTMLKVKFSDPSICPLLVIANEANRKGVVGGILGACDVVVVSGESISMISEALDADKPVIVFMPSEKVNLKPKHQEFLDNLVKGNFVIQATPENIEKALERSESHSFGDLLNIRSRDKKALIQALKRVA